MQVKVSLFVLAHHQVTSSNVVLQFFFAIYPVFKERFKFSKKYPSPYSKWITCATAFLYQCAKIRNPSVSVTFWRECDTNSLVGRRSKETASTMPNEADAIGPAKSDSDQDKMEKSPSDDEKDDALTDMNATPENPHPRASASLPKPCHAR